METAQPSFLKDILKTSNDIWLKGWAERNAGNISVRLQRDELQGISVKKGAWMKLSKALPCLANDLFLVSGTGKYIRNISIEPEVNLGIVEIDDKGENYRIIWGYADGGQPTSEFSAHLQVHSTRRSHGSKKDNVVIHTHPTNLIALTYGRDLDTYRISKLLWEMHAECIVVFPEGVAFLPWMMAGSNEIADATAEAFQKRNLVVWQFHGAFSVGETLDEAFGIIDTAEKAAEIYFKAVSAGTIRHTLSLMQLDAIARNFGMVPDPEIFSVLLKNP